MAEQFQVGDRVLVTDVDRGVVNELATVEEVDEGDSRYKYWCVFDMGRKTERQSWEGLSEEEAWLDPGWQRKDQLQSA